MVVNWDKGATMKCRRYQFNIYQNRGLRVKLVTAEFGPPAAAPGLAALLAPAAPLTLLTPAALPALLASLAPARTGHQDTPG